MSKKQRRRLLFSNGLNSSWKDDEFFQKLTEKEDEEKRKRDISETLEREREAEEKRKRDFIETLEREKKEKERNQERNEAIRKEKAIREKEDAAKREKRKKLFVSKYDKANNMQVTCKYRTTWYAKKCGARFNVRKKTWEFQELCRKIYMKLKNDDFPNHIWITNPLQCPKCAEKMTPIPRRYSNMRMYFEYIDTVNFSSDDDD